MKEWVIRNGFWTLEEPASTAGTSGSTGNFTVTSGEELRFRILIERLDKIIKLLENEGEEAELKFDPDAGWDNPAPTEHIPKGVDIDLFCIKRLIRWLKMKEGEKS